MSSQTYGEIILRKGNLSESMIDLTFLRVLSLSLHLK